MDSRILGVHQGPSVPFLRVMIRLAGVNMVEEEMIGVAELGPKVGGSWSRSTTFV
jgi:hypothetical protein